jgi:hypothetical protein
MKPTDAAIGPDATGGRGRGFRFSGAALWWALLAVTWLLSVYGRELSSALDARWIMKYPAAWRLPFKRDISDAMKWLVEDASFGLFSFRDFTRGISWVIDLPYEFVRSALIDGFHVGVGNEAISIAPSLSWLAVIAIVVAIGRTAAGWRLAALVGGCFAYLAVFGQWDGAMVTLASVLISVPIGVAGGLASMRSCGRSWISCKRCRSSPIWCRSCFFSASVRCRRWWRQSSTRCRRWCGSPRWRCGAFPPRPASSAPWSVAPGVR